MDTMKRVARRRYLLSAVTFCGLAATPIPVMLLRSGVAWAAAGSEGTAAMAALARTLFPYGGLPDSVYAEVIGEVLAITAADPASRNLLQSLEDELDSVHGTPWSDLDANEQVAVLERRRGSASFEAVVGLVRFQLHYHPRLFELIGYPGSSVEYGGYLERGFDDIDWLPEAT